LTVLQLLLNAETLTTNHRQPKPDNISTFYENVSNIGLGRSQRRGKLRERNRGW